MPKRKTQEEVIADFKAQHGNRFDYSRVIYQGAAKKVEVICPAHGAFMITPSHHSRGVGCAKCKADNARISREEFIRRAVEAHGAAYDYSRLKEPFPGVSVKHEIRCVEHDLWFQQEGKAHLVGHTGCSRCRSELLLGPAQMRGKKTSVQEATESFIARAKEVHGETYDYSCAIYRGAGHNIQIICREHGVFTQLPGNHYAGAGCPQCGAARKGAGSFKEKCAELGIDYHRALKRRDAGLPEEKIFRQGFIRTEKVTRTAVTVGGQCFPNIAEACRALQPAASGSTILRWIEDGMSPEEAFSKIPNPGYAAGQIYKVSQVSTGKIYVGLTVMSLEERWKYHQEQAASNRVKSKHSLHYAIRRFGAADFVIEPLDTGTSKADLEGKEIHWIQRLGSMAPHGFNLNKGGVSGGANKKPRTIDGIRFKSTKAAANHLAKTRGISISAAKKRLANGRIDVKTPRPPGQSVVKTKEYKAWSAMKESSSSHESGIALDEGWRSDFKAWLDAVGPAPSPKHRFCRIDKNQGFIPGNCAWMTAAEDAECRIASGHELFGGVKPRHIRGASTMKGEGAAAPLKD